MTPLGRTLLGPMDAVCDWSRANLAELLAAREAVEGVGSAGAGRNSPTAGGDAAGGGGQGAAILGA